MVCNACRRLQDVVEEDERGLALDHLVDGVADRRCQMNAQLVPENHTQGRGEALRIERLVLDDENVGQRAKLSASSHELALLGEMTSAAGVEICSHGYFRALKRNAPNERE